MVDVTFVKFMVAGAVNDGAVEGLVCPLHASCLKVDVPGQHDGVCVNRGWFEWSEFVVQIRENLDFPVSPISKKRIDN